MDRGFRTYIVPFLLITALPACGAKHLSEGARINAENGLGIKGYDPVAYHRDAAPIKGVPEYKLRHDGVMYQFSTEGNKTLFSSNPQKYLPSYGGYCAYAMSIGRVVDVNPERWAIVDEQLYLNANRFAHALWKADKKGAIQKADVNWQKMNEALPQ